MLGKDWKDQWNGGSSKVLNQHLVNTIVLIVSDNGIINECLNS